MLLYESPQLRAGQVSKDFLQKMINRMMFGQYRHGPPGTSKKSSIRWLEGRLEKYKQTGNTELLVDIANFAMMEFMVPYHPKAHFKSEDSERNKK